MMGKKERKTLLKFKYIRRCECGKRFTSLDKRIKVCTDCRTW